MPLAAAPGRPMHARSIARLDPRILTSPASELARRRRRLEPFAVSAVERGRPPVDLSAADPARAAGRDRASPGAGGERPPLAIALPDGTLLELPLLPLATQQRVDEVLRRVSPEKRAGLERSARRLGDAAAEDVEAHRDCSAAGPDRRRRAAAALTTAAGEVEDILADGDEQADRRREGLFVGLAAVERGLVELFEAFGRRQELAREVRAEAAELEEMLASWPPGAVQSFGYTDVAAGAGGTPSPVEKNVTLTEPQARALAEELRQRAGDLATLSTVDGYRLQKTVQDYQQVTTTLSNILKSTDETARGAIANIQA